MADRHPVADRGGEAVVDVDRRVVLDARLSTDDDRVEVAPEDGVVPHGGARTDRDVPDDHRTRREVDHGEGKARQVKALMPEAPRREKPRVPTGVGGVGAGPAVLLSRRVEPVAVAAKG